MHSVRLREQKYVIVEKMNKSRLNQTSFWQFHDFVTCWIPCKWDYCKHCLQLVRNSRQVQSTLFHFSNLNSDSLSPWRPHWSNLTECSGIKPKPHWNEGKFVHKELRLARKGWRIFGARCHCPLKNNLQNDGAPVSVIGFTPYPGGSAGRTDLLFLHGEAASATSRLHPRCFSKHYSPTQLLPSASLVLIIALICSTTMTWGTGWGLLLGCACVTHGYTWPPASLRLLVPFASLECLFMNLYYYCIVPIKSICLHANQNRHSSVRTPSTRWYSAVIAQYSYFNQNF